MSKVKSFHIGNTLIHICDDYCISEKEVPEVLETIEQKLLPMLQETGRQENKSP